MTYRTYAISIVCADSLKFFDIVAIDIPAAIGDLRAAYGNDVEICSVTLAS